MWRQGSRRRSKSARKAAAPRPDPAENQTAAARRRSSSGVFCCRARYRETVESTVARRYDLTVTFSARAHSNIALIKYWGKADAALNLPAVPSLSLTLDALFTETTLSPVAGNVDRVELDGSEASEKATRRVVALLDAMAGQKRPRVLVQTANNFPTAGGLASSASGFAALAFAANLAFDLGLSPHRLSDFARRASASAARSVFGGFVQFKLGEPSATPLLNGEQWPLRLLVVLTAKGPKDVGSTEGMLLTQATSPYYPAWVHDSPGLFARGVKAVEDRDFTALGESMEASTLMMHATMMTARPAILYFNGVTLAAMQAVRQARAEGLSGYFTMDAGPHVKVLTTQGDAPQLAERLRAIPGVQDVLLCSPGPDAHRVAPSELASV